MSRSTTTKSSLAVKRETSTTNVIIIAVLVSVVSLGLAGYIAKILFSSIQLNTKILSKKSLAADTLKSNLEAAPELILNYQRLGSDKHTLLNHALPMDDDFPGLIALMERVSGMSAMTLKSVAPAGVTTLPIAASTVTNSGAAPQVSAKTTEPALMPKNYAFSANLSGTYPALKSLLANLELSARPMKVTQLSLTGTSNSMTVQLGLETYFEGPVRLDLGKEIVK